MNAIVIDASIAIKWVVEEEGTAEALALRQRSKMMAPDLLIPECANILWKKVHRGELLRDEAVMAAGLLQGAEIELFPMRSLLDATMRLSIEIDHPAYDCVYLALAVASNCPFVTADEGLLRKLRHGRHLALRGRAVSLREIVQR